MRRRFGLILATRIDSLSIVYEARGGKPPSISAHSFFDLFVSALFSVCLMLLVGRRENRAEKLCLPKSVVPKIVTFSLPRHSTQFPLQAVAVSGNLR